MKSAISSSEKGGMRGTWTVLRSEGPRSIALVHE
jgi:hypothetical protein